MTRPIGYFELRLGQREASRCKLLVADRSERRFGEPGKVTAFMQALSQYTSPVASSAGNQEQAEIEGAQSAHPPTKAVIKSDRGPASPDDPTEIHDGSLN